ncbi:MAG: sensor histidine kinase [Chloroflexi bacterium]|nr:sensor histidine kinase [Chloroflexota bacterium]
MPGRHEKDIYQFLSIYRFLSYGLAVLFFRVGPPSGAAELPDLQLYIILGLLGIYTVLKVFSPLRWREKGPASYIILAGDFLVCIALVTYSGGVTSIFLLYSLTPIMAASLLFEERIAISMALTASVILSVSHTILAQFMERFSWIMKNYNLELLIFYALFAIVSALVPFRINLNIHRRIESEAMLDERRRMAGEIHDGIAQSLSYLDMQTKLLGKAISAKSSEQALNELAVIRKVVENSYDDIRESIDQLGGEVRNVPLIPALAKYTKEFSTATGIISHLDVSKDFFRLSPTAELQLFRIAQELLSNVRRHAQATEVSITLGGNPRNVEMTVSDNGNGFIPDTLSAATVPGYHGLNIIRERAGSLGGNVNISSTPGRGTEVKIILPMAKVRL